MHTGGSESYSILGVIALALTLAMGLQPAPANAAGQLAMPAWNEVFHPEGLTKVKASRFESALQGLRGHSGKFQPGLLEAVLVEDNLSDGLATDMSVRIGADALNEDIIYNDVVSAVNDLGNAYVLAEADASGDLQIYVGVELLSPLADELPTHHYVEFELTQNFVQATAVNAPLKGERADGDLLVRIDLMASEPESIVIQRWSSSTGYQVIEKAKLASNNCRDAAMPYVVCAGAPPRLEGFERSEVWDMDGVPMDVTAPDRFLELGLDVAALLGTNPAFSSIVLRTFEDIAIDSFQALGHWGRINVIAGPGDGADRLERTK